MNNNSLTLDEGTSADSAARQQATPEYDNDAARRAYHESAALLDRSHWGLIRVTGSTRHPYLHNQTTADFNHLAPGYGTDAVFVTSTARCIDLVTALATEEAVWLITSPERLETLLDWMPRFVFFMDDVQFSDEGDRYTILSLFGPQSGTILAQLGVAALAGEPQGRHVLTTVAGVEEVRVAVGGGLVGEGYTLLVPSADRDTVWQALREAGAEPMAPELWESLRVEQGRPAADRELTEEHNPLELGLWEAVSFAKGCYIGQEIIARLDTYQKLKQQLWGLRLSAPVEPGTSVTVEGKEVGTVTSVTETPSGPFALAYIRTRAGGAGLDVRAGEASATVVDLPFLTRERSDLKPG